MSGHNFSGEHLLKYEPSPTFRKSRHILLRLVLSYHQLYQSCVLHLLHLCRHIHEQTHCRTRHVLPQRLSGNITSKAQCTRKGAFDHPNTGLAQMAKPLFHEHRTRELETRLHHCNSFWTIQIFPCQSCMEHLKLMAHLG